MVAEEHCYEEICGYCSDLGYPLCGETCLKLKNCNYENLVLIETKKMQCLS